MEDLQTKRELGKAFGELGRRTFDLVEAGKIEAVELELDVDRIRKLKLELEVEEPAVSGAAQR